MFTGQTQLAGTDLESTQVLIGELLERSFSLGSDSEAVGAVLKRPSLPSKCIVVAQGKKTNQTSPVKTVQLLLFSRN